MKRALTTFGNPFGLALYDKAQHARQPYKRTLTDIRHALENAGIIFIDEDDEGPGVRLKKTKSG